LQAGDKLGTNPCKDCVTLCNGSAGLLELLGDGSDAKPLVVKAWSPAELATPVVVRHLQAAVALAPTNADFLIALADGLLAHGEPDQARAAYQAAQARLDGHHFRFSLTNRTDAGLAAAQQALALIETVHVYTQQRSVGLVGHAAAELRRLCPSATAKTFERWSQAGLAAVLKPGAKFGGGGGSSDGDDGAVPFVATEASQLGWLRGFESCLTLRGNTCAKTNETSGDFHSAISKPAASAGGGVHTFTFTLGGAGLGSQGWRNSNFGLTTDDLTMNKSPSSFDHAFAMVYWKSGSFFFVNSGRNLTSSNLKATEHGNTCAIVVDMREGADGSVVFRCRHCPPSLVIPPLFSFAARV
jgi:hypothetical protein